MPLNVKIIIPIVVIIIVVIASLFILLQQRQQIQEQEIIQTPTPTPGATTPTLTPTPVQEYYSLEVRHYVFKTREPYDEERARYPDVYRVIDVELIVRVYNATVPVTIVKVQVIDLNNKTVFSGVSPHTKPEDVFSFTIPLTKEEYDNLFRETRSRRLTILIELRVAGETRIERRVILVEAIEETPTPTPPWGGRPEPI